MATSENNDIKVRNDRRDPISRYSKDIEEDITPVRKLLEEYSKIPPEQVVAHIHAVPEKSTHAPASAASSTSHSPSTPSTRPCSLASEPLPPPSVSSTSAAVSAKTSAASWPTAPAARTFTAPIYTVTKF
ncbi:hypothetical protein HO173_011121 [Letharia columbiana]|uniref:Uncharacterized protein n=1 Tax=Letharia columbiana TaxID=112416 RepID=A0A8H6FL97_9LECA|nr:uncharacterized protein HO173_011121 [Letharia columbiana]KAF6230584.1 hypothetical protein HO173_011121 [Letharia columbiana]